MEVSNSLRFTLFFVIFLQLFQFIYSDCAMQSYCNGHGTCIEATSKCSCFEGWGADTDISYYKAPDCSSRVCPSGKAWADLPNTQGNAHSRKECSNRGKCDRTTGECQCFPGFTGSACHRLACPNDCSGHGICVSLKEMAKMSNALPLAPNTFYEGDSDGTTWDEEMIFGCVCDSSWPVGLGAGERQEPEWFGPDCSQRHCPSNDNPKTLSLNELDCEGVRAASSIHRGEAGNLCQVDCSGQGRCDHQTGLCSCFSGQYGDDCSLIDPNFVYEKWNTR